MTKLAVSSQNALLAAAGALAVLGGMIGSPDGKLLALALAGICAAVLLFRATSLIRRILALCILLAVMLQLVPAWRQHRALQDRYRDHVSPAASKSMR